MKKVFLKTIAVVSFFYFIFGAVQQTSKQAYMNIGKNESLIIGEGKITLNIKRDKGEGSLEINIPDNKITITTSEHTSNNKITSKIFDVEFETLTEDTSKGVIIDTDTGQEFRIDSEKMNSLTVINPGYPLISEELLKQLKENE
jgi:hypothetical protein